jgi:hypothetical protein
VPAPFISKSAVFEFSVLYFLKSSGVESAHPGKGGSTMPSKISLAAISAAILIAAAVASPAANAAFPDDPCALLTPAQISAAVGVQVSAGVPTSNKHTCTWTATTHAPNSTKFVTLFFQPADTFESSKGKAMGGVVVTPVSGLGEDAFYMGVATNIFLFVKKGTVSFKVSVYADIPLDKKESMEKTLAQQVVSKL